MGSKTVRIALIALGILLCLHGVSAAVEPLRVTQNLRSEEVVLPRSAPEKDHFTHLGTLAMMEKSSIVSVLDLYDDPSTERSVDYLELYDPSGELLVICWFDGYGIVRLAMDLGLLQEEKVALEHILVLVDSGTSL